MNTIKAEVFTGKKAIQVASRIRKAKRFTTIVRGADSNDWYSYCNFVPCKFIADHQFPDAVRIIVNKDGGIDDYFVAALFTCGKKIMALVLNKKYAREFAFGLLPYDTTEATVHDASFSSIHGLN